MTNKDKYKEAFGVLQPKTTTWEDQPMKGNNNIRTFKAKRILALAAVVVILAVAAVGTYAANVGGIQTTLKTWFHGKEVSVDVSTGENGEYRFEVKDENGETAEEVSAVFEGGGVAIERFGKDRPLTPQEVLEANNLDIVREEDGRMMLYYYDQSYDITDLFSDEGVCKVKLKENGETRKTLYIDVELYGEDGGFGFSTNHRPDGSKADYVSLDG